MAEAQAILTKEERGSSQKITLKQASKITGIEPLIIINHIEEGRLKAERTGSRYNIDIAELKGYACDLYENRGNIKMYNPFICFDANISFYL